MFDESIPEGAPERVLDDRRLRVMGWRPRVGLEEGLAATYAAFVEAGVGRKKKKRLAP